MAFTASVRVDDRRMRRDLKRVKGPISRKVMRQALNRAGTRSRTAAVRETAKDTGIKQKVIRERMKLRRASRRRLRAVLTALTLGVRAIDAGKARQNAAGVRVAGRSFPGAFITTVPSGKQGVFRRKPSAASSTGRDSKGRPKKNRLPIEHVRIPIRTEATRAALKAVNTVGAREWVKEAERLLARELRKLRG